MSREAFEAWIKLDSTLPVECDGEGYRDMDVYLMWRAWQAAQADAYERLRAAALRDAKRLDFAAMNGLLPLDSKTGTVGGNGLRSVAADRASIDRAMCPHEHAVNDWRLHGA